jgi:hypothetical protein
MVPDIKRPINIDDAPVKYLDSDNKKEGRRGQRKEEGRRKEKGKRWRCTVFH